jgi:hypothetical protein
MNGRWGRWSLDPGELVLQIRKMGEEVYTIPLVTCNSSEEILDWIIRLRHKPWATGRDLCDLIDALDDLLGLEENFCGAGIDWTDGRVDYAMRILERKFGRRAVVSLPLQGEKS